MQNLKEDLTIVFCTYDKYSYLWNGFFKLLIKYWPSCDLNIVLNTEKKHLNYGELKISDPTNCDPSNPWSKRFKIALNKVETDYVLIMLDDFWLRSSVRVDVLNKCVALMKEDYNIKSFLFAWVPGLNKKSYKYAIFEQVRKFTPFRVNMQIGVWRKDYIMNLLTDSETPWQFEVNASVRSIFKAGKVLSFKKNELPVFDYDFGALVVSGGYKKEIMEYFIKSENVVVDLERIPVYVPKPKESNASIKRGARIIGYYVNAILSLFKK